MITVIQVSYGVDVPGEADQICKMGRVDKGIKKVGLRVSGNSSVGRASDCSGLNRSYRTVPGSNPGCRIFFMARFGLAF